MDSVIKFFVELMRKASILIGLVAMIGLIAQGKPFGAIVSGTVKTILGFLILGAGLAWLSAPSPRWVGSPRPASACRVPCR